MTNTSYPTFSRHGPCIPNNLVKGIITIAWVEPFFDSRWQFFKALCAVDRSWRVIARDVCLHFVIVENRHDLKNYTRFITEKEMTLNDRAALKKFFSTSHLRLDIDAFTLPPLLPAVRSVEINIQCNAKIDQSLARCFQLRGLQEVSVLHGAPWKVSMRLSELSFGPTVWYLHIGTHIRAPSRTGDGHRKMAKYHPLSHITRLRVSYPQSLVKFIPFMQRLEELNIDLSVDDSENRKFRIIQALEGGILCQERRRLVLNTSGSQPLCWGGVAQACGKLGIELEQRT